VPITDFVRLENVAKLQTGMRCLTLKYQATRI
jgi:NifU-like protein involved in Fe-S cluster formation